MTVYENLVQAQHLEFSLAEQAVRDMVRAPSCKSYGNMFARAAERAHALSIVIDNLDAETASIELA